MLSAMAPSSSELKSSQEYTVNAGLPHGSIFGPTFFLLYTDVLLLSMVIIQYSKYNQASDLWQQLELSSELKSDLRDIVDWGRE